MLSRQCGAGGKDGCCCLRDNVDISVCVFKVCMLESGLCLFLCVTCQRWKFIWIGSQIIVILLFLKSLITELQPVIALATNAFKLLKY